MWTKSIIIHEYQDKSARVNTNQHESTRINTSLTRINTSPTRLNTSPTRVSTNQHQSKTSQDHKKQNKFGQTKFKCNLSVVISRKTCGRLHLSMVQVFSPIYFQLYHKELLFYTGIYFIKHRVIIVTCNNYYATDSHFIKSSILKPITDS